MTIPASSFWGEGVMGESDSGKIIISLFFNIVFLIQVTMTKHVSILKAGGNSISQNYQNKHGLVGETFAHIEYLVHKYVKCIFLVLRKSSLKI